MEDAPVHETGLGLVVLGKRDAWVQVRVLPPPPFDTMSSTKASGISFCSLLAVAFIVLKLLGAIQWSWLWVLAPLWLPAAVALLFVGGFMLFGFVGICWVSYVMSSKGGGR